MYLSFYNQNFRKTVYYSSETLFNTDTLLEVAIIYNQCPSFGCGLGNIYIINETSAIVDSITNVFLPGPENTFKIHGITSTTFIATVLTTSGAQVYNLPGTLPCDICGGDLGLATTEEKQSHILSTPIPNPSKDQVKITFTLPDGVTRGQLQLFSSEGKRIKTWEVDNRFGYILFDNSELPTGVYYYNIVVNGGISSTQKMVVIK